MIDNLIHFGVKTSLSWWFIVGFPKKDGFWGLSTPLLEGHTFDQTKIVNPWHIIDRRFSLPQGFFVV